MVAFNPEFQSAPTPDWTRESQGRGANRGLETLFAGVGDAINSYAQTQDKLIRQNISLAASDAANQAAESPDMFKVDTPNTPQAITDAVKETNRLKQAYNQGAISDLDYMSRVDMRLKRLKSQYPGYRDVIDAEFSSAMGTSLANDIRREQLQQAERAASAGNEAAKNEREWREAHGDELYLAFGPSLGADKSFDEVKSAAYKVGADKLQWDYENHKITQMEKGTQLQKEQAKKNMTNQVSAALDASLRITLGSGETVGMNEAIDRFMQPDSEGGATISEQERQQLILGLNKAERDINTQVQQLFTGNLTDGKDGNYISYAGILTDQKDREDIMALPKQRFDIIRKALTDGDTGLLKEAARSADYRIDSQMQKMILGPNGDAYTTLGALKKMGVDLSLFQGSAKATELGDKTLQFIIDQFPKNAAAGSGNDFGTTIGQLEASGVVDPAAYRGLLNNTAAALVHPDMPQEAFNNEAKAFFNKKNMDLLEKFAEPNAPDLFKKFVNPVITNKVMASGDQELIANYRGWAFNQFGRVTRQGLQELKSAATYETGGEITFDGEKFTLPPQKEIYGQAIGGASPRLEQGVSTINDYLQNVKPLLQSPGIDTATFIQKQFGATSFAGVEPQGQALVDAVSNWFQKEQKGAEEAGKAGAYPPASKGTGDQSSLETTSAAQLISHFEGFSSKPYWDVNAHRAGYGSDTVTLADGSVHRVTRNTRVTKEDAQRDLNRRVAEFQAGVVDDVGTDTWNSLTDGQKAALTSVAYNYGEVPKRVLRALKSGASVSDAILLLQNDNAGVNAKRRRAEARVAMA